MAASYPSSAKSFSTKTTGTTIAASHINDAQDEIAAIEGGLLNGVAHALKPSAAGGQDLGTSTVQWHHLYLDGVSGGIPYFSDAVTVAASALLTNHAVVVGAGAGAAPKTLAAMTTGQLLYGVTGADPTPSQAALTHSTPANQTGNATATFKMNGLAATITPVVTGRVIFTITGNATNSVGGDAITLKLAYGTGAAPANAAAATGTVISATQIMTIVTGGDQLGFAITASVTGLALATAVWFDLQIANITGGTVTVTSIDCTAVEV